MKKLLIILIAFIVTGCSVEKQIYRTNKMIKKHPSVLDSYITVKDSVSYKDTTIYSDTTLYDTIPGEHRIDSVLIESAPTRIDPLNIQMEHLSVDIWIENGKIYAEINMPPTVRKWRLDSALVEKSKLEQKFTSEILRPPPEKESIKWYYKAALWGFVGMIFLLIVLIVILKLLKRFSKL